MRGITSIEYVTNLGTTPARVNRVTGECFINTPVFFNFPADIRLFILLHEAGHVVLNTTNEYEADNYAFEQYAKLGRSLKNSVKALSTVLPFSNQEQYNRVIQQFIRAYEYDNYHNHNKKTNHTLNNMYHILDKESIPERMQREKYENTSSIFGLSKTERDARLARKKLMSESKADAIRAGKAYGIGAAFGKIGEGAASVAGAWLGKGMGKRGAEDEAGAGAGAAGGGQNNKKDPDPDPKDNTTMYIIAGVVVAALALFLIMRKKS